MINNFENALTTHKNAVCFSPKMIDIKFDNEKLINRRLIGINTLFNTKVDYSITSGSLFIQNSFLKVGKINEKLFIDLVDMDWCERAKINDFKLFRSNDVFLKHCIGSRYIEIFGIKKSYHQLDLRVYYIIRNNISYFIW